MLEVMPARRCNGFSPGGVVTISDKITRCLISLCVTRPWNPSVFHAVKYEKLIDKVISWAMTFEQSDNVNSTNPIQLRRIVAFKRPYDPKGRVLLYAISGQWSIWALQYLGIN